MAMIWDNGADAHHTVKDGGRNVGTDGKESLMRLLFSDLMAEGWRIRYMLPLVQIGRTASNHQANIRCQLLCCSIIIQVAEKNR